MSHRQRAGQPVCLRGCWEIWTAESKIIAERRLWLAVLRAQRDLGVDFGADDPAVVAAYEGVVDDVDLARSPRGSGSPATT